MLRRGRHFFDPILTKGFDPILTIGVVFSIAVGAMLVPMVDDNTLGLLVGLVVMAVTILIDIIARQKNAKDEIINSLKGVRVEVFRTDQDFSNVKYRLLREASSYVYDTELSSISPASSSESEFRKKLHQRIAKGEITYKYIRVIFSKSQFEQLLEWLFRFHQYDYYIGYFLAPPEVIPALNLMIFDHKHFLMGGYYGPSARGDDRNLYVQHDLMAATLVQYFDYLWSQARLFNEYKAVDWEQIQYCGKALGYTVEDLNSTVSERAQLANFEGVKRIEY